MTATVADDLAKLDEKHRTSVLASVCLRLARQLDAYGSAMVAKEPRETWLELTGDLPAAEETSLSDEIAAARAKRTGRAAR